MPTESVQSQLLGSLLRTAARQGNAGWDQLAATLHGALGGCTTDTRAAARAMLARVVEDTAP